MPVEMLRPLMVMLLVRLQSIISHIKCYWLKKCYIYFTEYHRNAKIRLYSSMNIVYNFHIERYYLQNVNIYFTECRRVISCLEVNNSCSDNGTYCFLSGSRMCSYCQGFLSRAWIASGYRTIYN